MARSVPTRKVGARIMSLASAMRVCISLSLSLSLGRAPSFPATRAVPPARRPNGELLRPGVSELRRIPNPGGQNAIIRTSSDVGLFPDLGSDMGFFPNPQSRQRHWPFPKSRCFSECRRQSYRPTTENNYHMLCCVAHLGHYED